MRSFTPSNDGASASAIRATTNTYASSSTNITAAMTRPIRIAKCRNERVREQRAHRRYQRERHDVTGKERRRRGGFECDDGPRRCRLRDDRANSIDQCHALPRFEAPGVCRLASTASEADTCMGIFRSVESRRTSGTHTSRRESNPAAFRVHDAVPREAGHDEVERGAVVMGERFGQLRLQVDAAKYARLRRAHAERSMTRPRAKRVVRSKRRLSCGVRGLAWSPRRPRRARSGRAARPHIRSRWGRANISARERCRASRPSPSSRS